MRLTITWGTSWRRPSRRWCRVPPTPPHPAPGADRPGRRGDPPSFGRLPGPMTFGSGTSRSPACQCTSLSRALPASPRPARPTPGRRRTGSRTLPRRSAPRSVRAACPRPGCPHGPARPAPAAGTARTAAAGYRRAYVTTPDQQAAVRAIYQVIRSAPGRWRSGASTVSRTARAGYTVMPSAVFTTTRPGARPPAPDAPVRTTAPRSAASVPPAAAVARRRPAGTSCGFFVGILVRAPGREDT